MSVPLFRKIATLIARWTKKAEGQFAIYSLAIAGAIWGLVYGGIMDLWGWPFILGPADQYWAPGVTFAETVQRFGVYYLATSLAWDMARSAGNVLFILLFAAPTLRALERFKRRFSFQLAIDPVVQSGSGLEREHR